MHSCSLGIYNCLWVLLEEQCKGLDFSLATERVRSFNVIHDPNAADLHKLLRMKSELEKIILSI